MLTLAVLHSYEAKMVTYTAQELSKLKGKSASWVMRSASRYKFFLRIQD